MQLIRKRIFFTKTPIPYTRLEYMQCNNSTSYLIIPLIIKKEHDVYLKWYYEKDSSNRCGAFFGYTKNEEHFWSSNYSAFTLGYGWYNPSQARINVTSINSNNAEDSIIPTSNSILEFTWIANTTKCTIYKDSVKFKESDITNGIRNDTLDKSYLFAINADGSVLFGDCSSKSSSRLYEYIQSQNGKKLVHLIPIKDINGVVCAYDIISQTIIYNSGIGEFIAGPEINNSTYQNNFV